LIDRHWYGEPLSYVQDPTGAVLALIPDPDAFPKDDSKIYASTVPRTIDGSTKFPPGDNGSGLQPIAEQDDFALRYHRYTQPLGEGSISIDAVANTAIWIPGEVWTIEMAADGQTLHVRSSLRGSFPTGTASTTSLSNPYEIKPAGIESSVTFFTVTAVSMEPGDAFILDTPPVGPPALRTIGSFTGFVNLNGWWELMGTAQLSPHYAGGKISDGDELLFTTADPQHAWVIFVHKLRQSPSNNIIGYAVHNRTLRLTLHSQNTKFWFNSVDQLLDNDTKKRVYDNIKILRSNDDAAGKKLAQSQIYDVVGAMKDQDGIVDQHSLEIVPTDLLQEDDSGDLVPDRLLQFETFAGDSFEYFAIANPLAIIPNPSATFANGAFVDDTLTFGRRPRMPRVSNLADVGLDFMWQHFSPFTNIIDPSVTNIHDAYVMTRGYYDNVINYVRGISPYAPTAPTPLELRNSYGYLLENKMLSDTVVLHPGKIRLLFGGLAEPQLRAKFKVVRSQAGTLTNERIKEEILNVINTFFDIDSWDFGDTFYATRLISLIHQRLPVDIASVVLVPVYSTNSFGSLFTVETGFDEILQSAAELADIEVVEALTPTVIRQR
jgi:hypothetical protein